jgi:hypothetical protein
MAVRARFGLFYLLKTDLQLNCLPRPLLLRNKLKTKNAATLNFSMCGCPCMANVVSNVFKKMQNVFYCNHILLKQPSSGKSSGI